MLKYVNPDFQISDLKTGDLVIVVCDAKIETTFKKLIGGKQRYVFKTLKPYKWQEKIIVSMRDVN